MIAAFGGVRPLARLLGIAPSAVCMWRTKPERMGTIPTKKHKQILEHAKKLKIDVTPEDLILGRKIKHNKKTKGNK